ncbi:hypothetical protein Tco_0258152, partial [Tanacetum coccineum]
EIAAKAFTADADHAHLETVADALVVSYESLRDLKSDYNVYEGIVFGKTKEGVYFTASHPFATSGLVIGSGILASKSKGFTMLLCIA